MFCHFRSDLNLIWSYFDLNSNLGGKLFGSGAASCFDDTDVEPYICKRFLIVDLSWT
jgi:hypothetical protein